MAKGKTLGEYIEKWHVKKADWQGKHELEVLGVSNVDGITTTSHVKSDDLSGYLVIEPNTFAYNPYRINVGSVGLTPNNVFGVVSPAYIVFKVRKGKLIPELLLEFLKSFDGLQQINKYARGTVRKALRFDDLCKIEVNFPDFNEQKNIFEKKLIVEKKSDELQSEIQTQKQLLTQLKQSILQEAIQGKLTADWREQNPNTEPASDLLNRIKAEKAQLIKDKKIKKENALLSITAEEIPFELPEGWVWCRLGKINNIFLGGAAFSSSRFISDSNIQVIRISNVKNDELNTFKNPVYIDEKNASENSRNELFKRDILITMTGTREKKDYCFTVELTDNHFINKRLFLNQRVGCFRLNTNINATYTSLALKSQSLLAPVFESSTGSANQANISKSSLLDIVFPLPPVEEQKAIVEKVESLMQKCQALEQEIKTSETNAQMLMQAVLKEAFESKSKSIEA